MPKLPHPLPSLAKLFGQLGPHPDTPIWQLFPFYKSVKINLDRVTSPIRAKERVFYGIPSFRVENPVVRSSQAMLETVTRTLSASKEAWTEGSSVLDQLDSIEVRIKQHMQGNLVNEEATIATESEPSGKVQPSSPLAPTQPSSSSPLTTPPPTRPPVLRTLSELLPQVACDRLLLLHYALLAQST